jgi:hypothetical protein
MSSRLQEEVERLQKVVRQLEDRIAGLENKPGDATPTSMRMVLMGPPGAGESLDCAVKPLSDGRRQGHTGTRNQGQVLHMPSGR